MTCAERVRAYADATDILHDAFYRMGEEKPWWAYFPGSSLVWSEYWRKVHNAAGYTMRQMHIEIYREREAWKAAAEAIQKDKP